MLEIVALCSCACLACLWCVLAVEVVRDKCRDGKWIFRKARGCERCTRCEYVRRCKRDAQGHEAQRAPCKNFHSCLHPPCAFPTYKFVCKICRRAKPECICAKLFCHRMALSRSARYERADASSLRKSSLPSLACREIPQLSPEQLATCPRCTVFSQDANESREDQYDKADRNCKSRRSSCKRILKKSRKRRKSKHARERR